MKVKKSLKNKIKSTISDSKTMIQDRIQQIRRSYPYSDISKLPGLSVSQLAGDPSNVYSSKATLKDLKSKVITDLNTLALF